MEDISFSRDSIERLNQAEGELNRLAPQIEKAESCGIDCAGHRAIVQEIQRKIQAMRSAYPQLTQP